MSYKILNTLLPIDNRDKMYSDTLDMLMKGQNLSKSPLAEWGRLSLKNGRWWYGCEKAKDKEECIKQRMNTFIKLYHSIHENGYNGSTISIFFDEEGQVHVYDGNHRLAIMKYLNIRPKINCVITTRDPNPARRGDFPLIKTIVALNKGKNLYQPCDDPRLKAFGVWRHDSPQRLAYILKHIKGKTVLDIGCSEGYFSRELAKKGFNVTAIDIDKRRVAVTRYLATINSLKLNYHVGKWQEYLKGDVEFDNILFLSVFHHDMLRMKPSKAFDALKVFRGKAKRIFFETPIKSSDIKWLDQERKKLWDISEDTFKAKIEEATQMTINDTWYGIRPLFLLES